MIKIEAKVHFISTEDGGRQSPIQKVKPEENVRPYPPNFVFGYPHPMEKLKTNTGYKFSNNIEGVTKSIDGTVLFKEDFAYPGTTHIVEINFRDTNYIDEFLKKDTFFLVREGSRVVATGKILEILEKPSLHNKD